MSSPQPEQSTSPRAFYREAVEDVCRRLETSDQGLSAAEAAARLDKYGPNRLAAGHQVSKWEILLGQFKNILILILLAATAFSAFVGHGLEALAIALIVAFAVILGFIQEYRAERAIEALSRMAAPEAKIWRDGQEVVLPAEEVVPGDVILLRAGDRIPADARVLEAVNLRVEESALTGESVAVEKQQQALTEEDLVLGDQTNMLFGGTAISYGRGRGVVVATGMQTEFGKIAGMLQTVEVGTTPLQENLDKVGKRLAQAGFAVVALIVLLGLLRGQPWLEMLIFGIALAVAVVPEALPAVVTISLAIGVQRMARRNALVRRLPAVETLGSVSVICTDKTGTLTRDEMTVRRIVAAGQSWFVGGSGYSPEGEIQQAGQPSEAPEVVRELLRAAVLSSDAHLLQDEDSRAWHIQGDATEGALVVAAAKLGIEQDPLQAELKRVDEIPFSSETKRMTTLHDAPDGLLACAKGAPEVLLPSCTSQLDAEGRRVDLSEADRDAVLATAQEMAGEALRVLAIAERRQTDREHAEQELTLLGLVGMIDPPRPEAQAAVQQCEAAGIKAVMITGDHPTTAQAIARELGILKTGQSLTGSEVERLSAAELAERVREIEVFARVSPKHKLRVVESLQEHGQVVAMTGDGVNDAPALKKADIGVAMGRTGTDVTKEASDMTLTDDNFASIVAAIEEGRIIFGNIKKYLMYLLSSNIGEIGLMAGSSFAGLPLPLTAVQLLYVNLATDGLPAIALAVDPPEPDLMERSPRDPKTGIFTRPVVFLMLVGGFWSAAVNMGIFTWALGHRSREEAMTLTFTSLVLIQFFKAYNFRSDHVSVLHQPFANRWLNRAIIAQCLLTLLILYVPILQKPFRTVGLSLSDWLIVGVASLTISPVLEAAKWWIRRRETAAGPAAAG